MKINENYKNLEESYLFSTIAKKVDEYTKAHPEAKVIKMGIGDVTLPICQKAADAFAKAAMEQGEAATFHGYGPEQGSEPCCPHQRDRGYFRHHSSRRR